VGLVTCGEEVVAGAAGKPSVPQTYLLRQACSKWQGRPHICSHPRDTTAALVSVFTPQSQLVCTHPTGYYGRPFEARNKPKGSSFTGDNKVCLYQGHR
jgi:hypothetical protein